MGEQINQLTVVEKGVTKVGSEDIISIKENTLVFRVDGKTRTLKTEDTRLESVASHLTPHYVYGYSDRVVHKGRTYVFYFRTKEDLQPFSNWLLWPHSQKPEFWDRPW